MAFSVRKPVSSDLDRISNLLNQLGYNPQIDQIKDSIDSTSGEVYVAEESGIVIGLMSLIYFDYFPTVQKICRITAIVVEETQRSQGIGLKLIEFAESESKKRKCVGLEITTSTKRHETHAYYEKLGFDKTSFRYYKSLESSI
ncbi:MAG: GNAT family N-acetyltransferase [Sulfuricurvum sp.]|nr:GNAT family N-acetyltransferase [Sulfuricurvum sp.]